MRKKTIVNIFHYGVKYLLIALPVILILLSMFVTNEDFKGSSEFVYSYKYNTNVVNSVDDLVVGNAYHYDLTNVDSFSGSLNVDTFFGSSTLIASNTWFPVTWSGLNSFSSLYIWSDGTNYFYSHGTSQYIIDTATYTLTPISWNGDFTTPSGEYIWSDGTTIYYSNGASQYIIDTVTYTLTPISWSGDITTPSGVYIWSDGVDYYYTYGNKSYVVDLSTLTWSTMTWNWYNPSYGNYIWSDGVHVFYSQSAVTQFVLSDVSTHTWSTISWNGISTLNASNIWFAGDNIYYSSSSSQYIIDTNTYTATPVTWAVLDSLSGARVWSDGNDILYSDGADQYILKSSAFSSEASTLVGNFIYNSHTEDFTDISFISPLSVEDNFIQDFEYVDGGLFYDICYFFNKFVNLPINSWYVDFLNLIGVGSLVTNTALGLMFYMPLWIAYIFIFDLFLDALLMLPKTAHHWIEKIGGDYE